MKNNENIESMFSRFKFLVFRLQVLNKSYTTVDHIKKTLRSLPIKFRPKVFAIQEAKYLNSLSLEGLIRNIQSYKMKLNEDDPDKQVGTQALKFVRGSEKFSQNLKEATHDKASDDDELDFSIKIFKYLAIKKNKFYGKRDNFNGSSSGSKDQDGCYNCMKPSYYN